MIKQPIVKGKTDVLFLNAMLESGRVKFNGELVPLLHVSHYSVKLKDLKRHTQFN